MSEVYRAPAVRLSASVQLVDFAGNPALSVGPDGDVTDRLEYSGSIISHSASSAITGTAQFVFRDVRGFNPGTQLLRPTLTLTDTITGRSVQRQFGLYTMKPFTTSLERNQVVTIECSDMTELLATNLRTDFHALDGEAVGVVLTRLLGQHGLTGLAWIPPAIPSRLASNPSWAVTEQLTYLEVANEILHSSGYDNIYMTREGALTSLEWEPIQNGAVTWTFDNTAERNYISDATHTEPSLDIPNYWIGVCSAIDQLGICTPFIKENLSPLSPWSIPNQGGRITTRVIEAPVATTSALQIEVNRIAEADYLRPTRIRLYSGPILDIWHLDKVLINLESANLNIINQRGLVREWHLPLDYGNNQAIYVVDVGEQGLTL